MTERRFKPRALAGLRPSNDGPMIMRARWRDLAELVRQSARTAADRPLDRLDEAHLANQLRRSATAELPVEGESGKRVRAAFLEAGQALLLAAGDRRAIAAELAAAAAVAVLNLLDLEARRAAAGWQKQFGD